MDRASAERLLKQALEQPFEEARFKLLAKNLVNDLEKPSTSLVTGGQIKDAYKDHVQFYKRLGKYVDPEQNVIDVVWVKLKKSTSLERARTKQRNFIADYLQTRGGKDAALVAYSADDAEDWRFSFVRVDYRLEQKPDGTYKPKKEVTAARRASFLVGANEPSHTAQQQLLPLLLNDQNPVLDDLEETFSIESVTKEFFEEYKKLFLRVNDELEALQENDPDIKADFAAKQINLANFAKKFLGQIVFLYFLQKKGWLGVEPGQDWGSGPKKFLRQLFDRSTSYENFFNDVLEHLFYEALAMDRGTDALYSIDGHEPFKIPFLNGGLFEPIGGYDWRKTNILIENATVQAILDTFDLYNFTVREDEPLDKEVAVDPEMLGKVFENLLEVKDRKSKGAFYTPREIVHYMCQESLINYLDTTVNMQTVEVAPAAVEQTSLFVVAESSEQLPLTKQEYREQVPRQDLEQLIRQGERAIENDAQVVQRGVETQTYQYRVPESVRQYAVDIDQALADIKICDPAIGSGAFPVGMMQEIVKVRGVLSTYLPDEDRTAYGFKRHAIQASIYGVDIDAGAVDIAKLRLWLSLVVDEEDYGSIKPLPNLDYKIVCGNSLLGVDIRGEVKDYQTNFLNYQQLEKLDELKNKFFDETHPDRKAKLSGDIKTLIEELTGSSDTFDFKVHFSEVFQENSGFDIVIGNPPYVRQEQIKHLKDELKQQYNCYVGTADLYVYFYEKGIKILREQGVLTYISSNKYFRAAYGKKLRKFIADETRIHQIIDFGDAPVFAAIAYPTIVLIERNGSNSKKHNDDSWQFQALNWKTDKSLDSFDDAIQTQTFTMPQKSLNITGWQFLDADSLEILERLRQVGIPLGEYVKGRFYYGIKTGFNQAFIVDQVTRDRLIAEHPSSEEVLKPFLRGRDVKRWNIDFQDLWLLFIPWHFPLHEDETIEGASKKAEEAFKEEYPAIYSHLLSHKEKLSSRNKAETGIRYEWYALQRCAASYWQEFNHLKIIYPDIYEHQSFTVDDTGYFAGNTCYFIPTDETWLCGLLNSSVIEWFYRNTSNSVRGGYLRAFSTYIQQIPIPKISEEKQKNVQILVEYILYLNKKLKGIPSQGELLSKTSADKVMLRYFEQVLDAIILEFYLSDELLKHEKYFMRHLLAEDAPSLNNIQENKINHLRNTFERLYDQDHPIRKALFFLDSVPMVRIIRGLK